MLGRLYIFFLFRKISSNFGRRMRNFQGIQEKCDLVPRIIVVSCSIVGLMWGMMSCISCVLDRKLTGNARFPGTKCKLYRK